MLITHYDEIGMWFVVFLKRDYWTFERRLNAVFILQIKLWIRKQ